jgi:hypothetical protein
MSWPVSGFAIDRSKADFSRCPKIDSRFSQLKTGLDLLGSGSIPMFCSGMMCNTLLADPPVRRYWTPQP